VVPGKMANLLRDLEDVEKRTTQWLTMQPIIYRQNTLVCLKEIRKTVAED
jgi:DNA-binding Lrp family transcriptional regulator